MFYQAKNMVGNEHRKLAMADITMWFDTDGKNLELTQLGEFFMHT